MHCTMRHHVRFIAAILAMCAINTISQIEDSDSGYCRLKCGDRSQDLPVQKGGKGDIGHVGEVGERGDSGRIGKQGKKGMVGASCQCLMQTRKEIDEINSLLNAKKPEECPQSRFYSLPRTVSGYVRIKSPLPPLSNATICAFITSKYYSGSISGSIFSYATPGLNKALELQFKEYSAGIEVSLYRETKLFPDNNLYNQKEWHICLAFSRPAGFAKFYVDGKLYANFQYETTEPIPSGGTFVLAQEQGSMLSGFDKDKTFFGEIRNFMVWDRLLTEDEMSPSRSSSCSCVKDYIIALTPDAVQIVGNAHTLMVDKCT